MAATLALLFLSTPASSHCYSVWRYPWPQQCGMTAHGTAKLIPAAQQRNGIIETTKPPPDDEGRAEGIERLKRAIREQFGNE